MDHIIIELIFIFFTRVQAREILQYFFLLIVNQGIRYHNIMT